MPNARDIPLETNASILLVGDGGTHKTFFIGTCPPPIYVFDFDAGMSIHRGKDIDYDTFKEVAKGEKVGPVFQKQGFYEWGKAWPAFYKKLNEIGRSLDDGTCKYKTIGFDSLTMLTDICMSYVLKENQRSEPEQRDWGAFLNNMSTVFGSATAWPIIKVVTAHIKRDENLLLKTIEKLPNIPGKFSGKVGTYFNEVYYTEAVAEQKGGAKAVRFFIRSMPDGIIKQAKSRDWNIPDNVETTWPAVIAARRNK